MNTSMTTSALVLAVVFPVYDGGVLKGVPKPVSVNCMSQVHSPTFKDRLHFRTKDKDQTTIWLFDGEELKIKIDLPIQASLALYRQY
ncbi:hypothetical protein DPMN_026167 [Dreissena polymorpha]|uniref:Uncharacterized protein n=1 Tax=Dreissena polymorpha TaxID=45954 RepID=A0A9D4LSX4_DREPO|nr:hypothetical protein DPMN_026167 [Dreissena polymorpha]